MHRTALCISTNDVYTRQHPTHGDNGVAAPGHRARVFVDGVDHELRHHLHTRDEVVGLQRERDSE